MRYTPFLIVFLLLSCSGSRTNSFVDMNGTECAATDELRTMLGKLTRWKTCTATIGANNKKLTLEHVESKGFLNTIPPGKSRPEKLIHLCAEQSYGEPFFCVLFNPFEKSSGWGTSCEGDNVEFSTRDTKIAFLRDAEELRMESTAKIRTADNRATIQGYNIQCTDRIQYTPSEKTEPAPF